MPANDYVPVPPTSAARCPCWSSRGLECPQHGPEAIYERQKGIPGVKPEGYPALVQPKRTPHRCPVCEGRGAVAAGFYPCCIHGQRGCILTGCQAASAAPCRSCKGEGVLWA